MSAAHATPPDHPAVILVPGARFFVRRIPLAPDAPADKQVELAVEGLSPFPLEQLFYGWVASADKRHALVYAAYRRNFSADEIAAWNAPRLVIPEFAFWAFARRPASHAAILQESGDTLTALAWDRESTLPALVLCREPAPEAAQPDAAALVLEFFRRSGFAAADLHPLHRPVVSDGLDRDGLHLQAGQDHTALLPASAFAAADLRDKALLVAKRRDGRRFTLAWRLFAGTAAALALCLLLEPALIGGRSVLTAKRGQLAARTDAVREIEGARLLATKLEKMTAQQLRPFEMLAVINAPRPRSIEFQRVGTGGPLTLQIEAETANAGDLRVYEEALRQLTPVERVQLRDPRMRAGRTTFQLEVTFKAGWSGQGGGA
ncbi:MAG: hypothetical protein ACO3DQ_05630 [Cephaloticoccus sp.]